MSTLGDVKNKVQQLFEMQQSVKYDEDALDIRKKELELMKRELLGVLEDSGLDNFKAPGIGMIGVRNNFSVTMPKDPEDKQKFMAFLEERNLRDLLTVNHQTLNAFYKEEMEKAIEAQDAEFSVPGLGEPKHYKTLYLKKG